MANIPNIPVWRDIGCSPIPLAQEERAEILIVGGGPVGLTLALDLGRRGRKVTLINQLDFISAGSKAICFAKRTLDIWSRLGVADRMIDKGVIWNVGKVFCGDSNDPLYQFDMQPVKGQKNPGFINLQQYHAEEILFEALQQYDNVDIRLGHAATALEQHDTGARVEVETAEGNYTVDAQWVIACDGNKSPIREMLGLDFEGRVFEDNFLIADVKFTEERPSERWFWFDPAFNRGQSALLHKQPDNVWRLDFQLGWDIDREACTKPENVEPFVRGMLGGDVEFDEEWYSVYTFQCRRMRHFVHDRVIFAGDSAHLVSPFGARGCNGGVADADNLGWKLDVVLSNPASLPLIDSYNEEATLTADENILNSTRSTDFMTPKSNMSIAFRDAVLELAADFAFARPFVNSGRLSTAVGYPESILNTKDRDEWHGGVAPGYPAIDAAIAETWLLDQLGGEFVLITNDLDIAVDGLKQIDLPGSGDAGSAASRYSMPPGSAYLVRPDQYVAARWLNPTKNDVVDALTRAKGLADNGQA
ncbi:FAD-dependent oxidoreductase [Parasphingorhabdus sp.]|uniref:FAD-dependent oxidoreductase n=1 Tax=Parasphingorhabdus sp. TaxID=2709688 RepID=UPI00326499CD